MKLHHTTAAVLTLALLLTSPVLRAQDTGSADFTRYVALGDSLTEAYRKALACDPVSAFGGIVAVNRPVTAAMAEPLTEVFTEVVVAPGFDDDALEICSRRRTCGS